MLQIYLFGDKESGFLDLDPGSVLDMESTTDMWDESLLDGEFSLPIDLPWTANNRRLTGFAERLENFSTASRSWKVIVYDNGFPEIPAGKLTILEKSGSFSYRRGKFSASVSGTKGLFGSQIKGKKLADLQLGGPITWSGMDSRQYAQQHMFNTIGTTPYYAFAPVAIENFFDQDRSDYDGEFIAKDTVNFIVQNGNTWQFGRPKSTDPQQAADQLTPEYNDYRTVPFFQFVYVLRKIFEEQGYSVSGDIFLPGNFEKAYIFNQCAIEYYSPTSFVDFNRKVVPANHMPDMLIVDFLQAAFSFFGMYPVFTGSNEVTLMYRVKQLRNKRVVSMNGVASAEFTSTYADATDETGWTLKYNWGNDGYYSDRIKDRKQKVLIGTVPVLSGLYALQAPAGQQLTTDCIAFVEVENMYYQVADTTTNPVKWDAWAEALEDYVQGEGSRAVDGGIAPLATYVKYIPSAGLYANAGRVGTRQTGSYYNNKFAKVSTAITSLQLFYVDLDAQFMPQSFCHNLDKYGNKRVPYSLAWGGRDGMANFHIEWQQVKDALQVVKTDYIVDQKVLTEMNEANCHEIGGVIFLPQMVERTIPLQRTATVSLVPL